MTKPHYAPDVFQHMLADLMAEVPWVSEREARMECFMAQEPTKYTYGTPPYDKTYTSVPFHSRVAKVLLALNDIWRKHQDQPYNSEKSEYNVCFLNRYDNQTHQLGWHSDDTPGMMHMHPIAVVSFGEPREIWVREKGAKGVVPAEDRYLLGDGSLFIMPAGFQLSHQHRIPKGDRAMGPRVSLTFRRYEP